MRETPVAAASMLATQASPSAVSRWRASCPASALTPSIWLTDVGRDAVEEEVGQGHEPPGTEELWAPFGRRRLA
jgi:hypothetical protein